MLKKITFIQPAIGKKPGERYIGTWKMEPLTIATLAALTPSAIERDFFDDRVELIPYGLQTDLVAITIETYTARRAYDIAAKFRARGIPVVVGGYHPTHMPQEAARHADSVIVGNAESVWAEMLDDAAAGRLKQSYHGRDGAFRVLPDRSIYNGKSYLPLGLVETGRGCGMRCDFCHITSFYDATYHPRPIAQVVQDIKNRGAKYYFFVDDNLVMNPAYAIELCRAIEPLKIRWAGQGTLALARNPQLLHWLKKSGCDVLLIGFESMQEENLAQMKKDWLPHLGDRQKLVEAIHQAGICIYATFIFGYDYDTPDSFKQALDFTLKNGFAYAAFNHLLPFPQTPFYTRLEKEGRLIEPLWWLNREYRYGQLTFRPRAMTPEQVSAQCLQARRKFFRASSIFRRAWLTFQRNPSWAFLSIFLQSNLSLMGEVEGKYDLPLGGGLDELPK